MSLASGLGILVGATAFLFLVALAATARPAWRAGHVDPAAALREE